MPLNHAFQERPCRRLTAVGLLLALGLIVAFALGTWLSARQMETKLVARECAVAGRLMNSHAASADAVADAFTDKHISASDQSLGARTFAVRGYDAPSADLLAPFFHTTLWKSTLFYAGCAILALLLYGVCALSSMTGIYAAIARVSAQAVEIGRGNLRVRLDQSAEGALGRMQTALNEVAAGIQATFDKMAKDRAFLKDLISDISHQLKTPLAALKMYQEILLQEPMEANAQAFVVRSGEQIERMEWLVLGLLKMARIEAGQLLFHLHPHDLCALTRQAAADFAHMAADKGVELTVANNGCPMLLCDAAWLREAVGNVVKNCIECTPAGGRVRLEASATPVMVTLTVRDTGPGIHPDDLPFVFRRFYRGHEHTGAGSGIGLSLAQAITEQMGGTLNAGGIFGEGAVFTFTFLFKSM
ncbi:MAG: HAMP domain-containing sensor histidine kinase [Ethanoligenens sp.]